MLKYGSNNVTFCLELRRVSEQYEAVFCGLECVEQFSKVFSSEVFEKALYESVLLSPTEHIALIDLHLLNYHKVKYNIQYFLVF